MLQAVFAFQEPVLTSAVVVDHGSPALLMPDFKFQKVAVAQHISRLQVVDYAHVLSQTADTQGRYVYVNS